MGRSVRSAKSAGTAFETATANALSELLGHEVKRMPRFGADDRGDVDGVYHNGAPLVIECKNPGKNSKFPLPQWWGETATEAKNSGTDQGILLIKRFGKSSPLDSWCVIDVDMFNLLDMNPETNIEVHSKNVPRELWVDEFVDGVHMFPRTGFKEDMSKWWVVSTFQTALDKYLELETLHTVIEKTPNPDRIDVTASYVHVTEENGSIIDLTPLLIEQGWTPTQ